MSEPSLAVFAPDAALRSGLESHLERTLLVCESLESVLHVCQSRELNVKWCVLDFRTPSFGGHPEQRLLEEILSNPKHPELWVLTTAQCPEPLERRLAGANVRRHRSPLDLDSLISELRTVIVGVRPAANMAAVEADYTLNGVTRRFETNTVALRRMLVDLETAAGYDVTILLIGETGSGKTFLSRLVHEVSPRRNEPFLHVACGALPADLIESELFGHVKGAFTSAHADKDGKFVAARRGTILLDEIDVLGPEQQVKLLRVIESGEFEPVGSNRTLRCEARLIVASNLDLAPLVEQGRFRPDLYYRLNMLKFELLPLRKRLPDLVPLARKFIAEMSAKHRIKIERIDEGLFDTMLRYPWPGNVRELENVIQRAVIYCRGGVLLAEHLPPHILACQAGPSAETRSPEAPEATHGSKGLLGRQVAMSERELIEQTLFKFNNSRTSTAKALGISRVTLYNKMKKYGMS
jgi:DNA-binding NtrC family response regulator